MSNRVHLQWSGLDELRKTLATLPATLQPEIDALVRYHARAAEGALLAAYPSVSGALRRGVRLESRQARGGAAAILVSRAPHAWIYERGTRPRQTKQGWPRGAAPAHNTFFRTVEPQGQRLYADLTSLLERRGFEVHDDAA
jgi:hypothetical protein